MPLLEENSCYWGSRRVFLMVMLGQTIGANAFITLPNSAIINGATGYALGYVISYIVFGIPLLYMEFTIGQFTSRDCIQVWRARECLSHFGYTQILYQLVMVVYNHMVISFVLHYFMISFEDPIPYYKCGPWSREDCGILVSNYTVNQDCTKVKEPLSYCEYLFTTFPEYQYWRYYILGTNIEHFHIAWRVCLSSGVSCIILFLCCFKTTTSLKWFIGILTLYPLIGYVVILIGSMMQKGVVVMYQDALDADFTVFFGRFRLTNIVYLAIHALNIGTGISFNVSSRSSFRSPCYANTVVTVAVSTVFTIVLVCSVAMMACPYAYEHGIRPYNILKFPVALVFEKVPRFIYRYGYRSFWLVLIYSCNAMVALNTNVVLIISLIDLIVKRNPRAAKYSILLCLGIIICLFLVTIPLLGRKGIFFFVEFRKYMNFIPTFCGMVELLVFVLWYGVKKYSEDVHFMQGIQPKKYMQVTWILSSVVLGYVFCTEVYIQCVIPESNVGDPVGRGCLLFILGGNVLIMIAKLSIAACKKRFRKAISVDPMWGPKSELLLRSRAMFTAQAMTKEYLYRQYHLQAGILARQRSSNMRAQRPTPNVGTQDTQ